MDRRYFLERGGLALFGLALGGCAAGPGLRTSVPRGLGLTPVRASWDRIIRTTVGFRPYRPSGFVVEARRLGQKFLVHNYGHGGAGMSLSWGTAHLAAELALQAPMSNRPRSTAVVGCGVVGLTTARQLQRRGFHVTIYADAVPPDTTSNRSLASWTPTSGLVGGGRRTPAWDRQFRRAANLAYRELQLLVGRGYGVEWIDTFSLSDRRPAERNGEVGDPLLPAHLRSGGQLLGPGEHPFPTRYATRRPTLRMEPSIYLDALVKDVREAGGEITIRRFRDPAEITALEQQVVVNCTGLGARELFGDDELVPVKGQLTHLVPQPEVDYGTFGGIRPGAGGFGLGIHMLPRSDGIALGGTSEEGVTSPEPNQEALRQIVAAHIALFRAMRGPE